MENSNKGHLVNNALAYLFSELRYEVAGKEVDMIRNPGITSWMKLLCSMNNQEQYSNAAIDSDNNLKDYFHSSSGKFSGCLPLSVVLGVFEDFNNILVNVKQELILKRAKNSLDNIFTTTAVPTTGSDLNKNTRKYTMDCATYSTILPKTSLLTENIITRQDFADSL